MAINLITSDLIKEIRMKLRSISFRNYFKVRLEEIDDDTLPIILKMCAIFPSFK